mmetsp:Transcript_11177/g.20777  ORF Transcript_11177/g.20777 Transcript_11177/m.20777 type:complete len:142 (+) Transcript_11177:10342-10767(+)
MNPHDLIRIHPSGLDLILKLQDPLLYTLNRDLEYLGGNHVYITTQCTSQVRRGVVSHIAKLAKTRQHHLHIHHLDLILTIKTQTNYETSKLLNNTTLTYIHNVHSSSLFNHTPIPPLSKNIPFTLLPSFHFCKVKLKSLLY